MHTACSYINSPRQDKKEKKSKIKTINHIIMRKTLILLLTILYVTISNAQDRPPHPFIENPAIQGINKEDARASFVSKITLEKPFYDFFGMDLARLIRVY